MNDLDQIKQHWKNSANFPKVTQDEIKKMIHKRSSSLVMWILVISILEFILLNFITKLIPIDSEDTPTGITLFDALADKFDYISISISLVFIFIFYKNYKKIAVYSSSKDLMKQILKTKKTVNYYIYLNLALLVCVLTFMIFCLFTYENALVPDGINASAYLLLVIFMLLSALVIFAIWLFYKLIYGFLLNKLMKNYKELEKIESH